MLGKTDVIIYIAVRTFQLKEIELFTISSKVDMKRDFWGGKPHQLNKPSAVHLINGRNFRLNNFKCIQIEANRNSRTCSHSFQIQSNQFRFTCRRISESKEIHTEPLTPAHSHHPYIFHLRLTSK